jgi:hypothetical protein
MSCMTESLQQTLTLSLRISEALRQRLEDIRKLTALRKGQSVSTSEIAKQLLESARGDRLEVVELLAKPTESMLEIRNKGEAGQMLTRAQWTLLAYFVQQGSEAFSKNPLSRESLVGILKAFDAAYRLRTKASEKDQYYLGNLPTECYPDGWQRSHPVSPELVRKTVAETVRRLSDAETNWTTLAARNLHVLLDDEELAGAASLNQALRPFWPVLWRVAARGHYFLQHGPIRKPEHEPVYLPAIPSLQKDSYTLSFARGEANEISLLLGFPGPRGPMYPLWPYPVIAEFRALLAAFPPTSPPQQSWDGEHFWGYVMEREKEVEFWFRAHTNAITFGFSAKEWRAVRELFRRAAEVPEVRSAWDALSLDYGEL